MEEMIPGPWVEVMPGLFEAWPPVILDNAEFLQLLRISNIPEVAMKSHRLQTWKRTDNDSEWWNIISGYAAGAYTHPFLTLFGKPGVGKTHLAFGIGFEWMNKGKTVLYYQAEMLLDSLRDGYKQDEYNSLMAFAQKAGLLIIDDLGAEKQSEWAQAKLDQIIDRRYIEKRPMVITSNLNLDKLPMRIADRLAEGQLVHIKGESYRRKTSGQARD